MCVCPAVTRVNSYLFGILEQSVAAFVLHLKRCQICDQVHHRCHHFGVDDEAALLSGDPPPMSVPSPARLTTSTNLLELQRDQPNHCCLGTSTAWTASICFNQGSDSSQISHPYCNGRSLITTMTRKILQKLLTFSILPPHLARHILFQISWVEVIKSLKNSSLKGNSKPGVISSILLNTSRSSHHTNHSSRSFQQSLNGINSLQVSFLAPRPVWRQGPIFRFDHNSKKHLFTKLLWIVASSKNDTLASREMRARQSWSYFHCWQRIWVHLWQTTASLIALVDQWRRSSDSVSLTPGHEEYRGIMRTQDTVEYKVHQVMRCTMVWE